MFLYLVVVNQNLYGFRVAHNRGLCRETRFHRTEPVKQGLKSILEHASEKERFFQLLLSEKI